MINNLKYLTVLNGKKLIIILAAGYMAVSCKYSVNSNYTNHNNLAAAGIEIKSMGTGAKWSRCFLTKSGVIYLKDSLMSIDKGRSVMPQNDINLEKILGAPERAVLSTGKGIYALDGPTEYVREGVYKGKAWRSEDNLKTLKEEEPVFNVPEGALPIRTKNEWFGIYVFRTILVMPDSSWLMTMEGNFRADTIAPYDGDARRETKFMQRTFIVTSEDKGHTWNYLSTVAAPRKGDPIGEGLVEPAITRLRDGRLLCIMRSGHHFPLYACWSHDNGASWTPPMYTGLDRGCDPCLITLHDGRVALSWGRRFPEGWSRLTAEGDKGDYIYPGKGYTNLAISNDGGLTWENHKIIQDSGSCYSTIFEVEPDVIFLQSDQWYCRITLKDLNLISSQAGNSQYFHQKITASQAQIKFPETLSMLQVDPHNPRHFSDTLGNPILLIGDSPQNLPQKLTIDQMKIYFADCRSKGINLCWVCIDGQPTDKPEEYAPIDRKGNLEFLSGGTPNNWDVSRLNPRYYTQTIDSVLILAENYGIYVNLMPMSQCYWSPVNIAANSPQKCYNYGVWLGNRYKNQRNIMWLFGNDNLDSSRQCPIARGIKSTGDRHLMSVHINNPRIWGPDSDNKGKGESANFFKHLPNSTMSWITYNNLYSDMEVFNQAEFIYHEYMKKDIMPILMTEGPYQKLSNYKWQVATNQVERGLNYRVALGGGFGGAYTYGCDWLQNSNSPWDKYLNQGARPHIKFFSDLFKARSWWNLVPDWTHDFMRETSLKGGSEIENDNYTMAAFDRAFGKLAVVYCTTVQTITLDLAKMSEPVIVRWYNPTSGEYINIPGSPFQNSGMHKFTTPAAGHSEICTDNSVETSNDWVLVVEAERAAK